jgi:hypothetical protein
MIRSDFHIRKVTATKVFIIDDNTGRMSVTKDAEAVVAKVNADYPGRRIIYRDSDLNWDELLHDNGRFIDFARYQEELP